MLHPSEVCLRVLLGVAVLDNSLEVVEDRGPAAASPRAVVEDPAGEILGETRLTIQCQVSFTLNPLEGR